MYRERTSVIDGAVVWNSTATPGEVRVLPDGCMDLIWADGELLVAGPDTRAHLADGDVARTGLRFAPGTGPRIFGIPAYELRDQRVPLDEVWSPPAARHATAQVEAVAARGRALERVARERLGATDPAGPPWATVAHGLRTGERVERLADRLGISVRQLHRRSLDAFGYGPKLLARILRMNDALALARAGVPFAETAFRSGYADQAHLARDVKVLAGVPLRALTS